MATLQVSHPEDHGSDPRKDSNQDQGMDTNNKEEEVDFDDVMMMDQVQENI